MKNTIKTLANNEGNKDLKCIIDKFPTFNINEKQILSKRQ